MAHDDEEMMPLPAFDTCPECGEDMLPGEECMCCASNEYARDKAAEDTMDRRRMGESTVTTGPFGRFMDRILVQEGASRPRRIEPDSPQRVRQARRQERPLGRIVVGRRPSR